MEQEIRRYLGDTAVVGRDLRCFDALESTNTYAREQENAPDGMVVIADYQTGGRGRLGRTFQSPRGKGLYLTVLLRPDLPPDRLLPVTALAGAAVCDAVEKVCGLRPGIKWPNDLVLGKKKLCGILTEMTLENGVCLVLGIGLNVSQTAEDFSPDVAEMATSLAVELERPVSRPALAAEIIRELDCLYAALKRGDLSRYLEIFRQDCVTLGKTVQLISPAGERDTVTAVDVDEKFGLVVRDEAGRERTVRSGEVSVRGMYGYV